MNISKTGILNSNIVEPFLTLPDGSNWQLLLFHYVDNGNNLFTQANAGYCNDFGLYSRLQWIDNFQYNNLYEFYVLQDYKEFRWSQTNAPLSTTAITGFTVITGTVRNGLCKRASGTAQHALLGETSSNTWWQACGSWDSYTSGGITGIPGFGGSSNSCIVKNYLALYARINNPKTFLEQNTSSGKQIYEY